MRFALDKTHHDFFAKHGYITFDEIIPLSDVLLFREEIERITSQRLKKMPETRSPQELFSVGRDLWRESEILSKLTLNRKLAEIAAGLTRQKALRIGYDQTLETGAETGVVLPEPKTVQEISCLQPVACAALIRLSPDLEPPLLLPKEVGSVLFFKTTFAFPWSEPFQTPNQCFLMIVYTPGKFRYVLNPQDLHTHALKKMGYGFGDAPTPVSHPFVYR